MATTLRIIEGEPAARPAVTGLSAAAAAIDASAVWSRLEGWCAHRWGVRSASFIADGCGAWESPLRPATITVTERWEAGEWVAATLAASPFGGFELDGAGPYRFAATVGDATAPAAVIEAFKRLAEYMAQSAGEVSAGTAALMSGSDGDFSFARPAGWAAQALHLSGASDLLRPWRHLGVS